ncbi:MAG: hypothetical protein K5923_00730 [Clostridia bacterium]|nr:hypothetical protein [Clostridia bacterium]
MIIYHAITTFHILKLTLHKLNYHKEDDAVLLVPTFLRRKSTGLKNITKDSIFKKVIFFDWDSKFSLIKDEVTLCDSIDRAMELELGKDWQSKIREINVCSAAYSFGIYLCNKGLKFNWFEEADGRLSDPYPIMANDSTLVPLRYMWANKYGLYTAQSPIIQKIYANMNRQLDGYNANNVQHYDVMEEMRTLSDSEKNQLLEFFDVPKDLEFPKNSVLLLTQHFHGLRMLTWEQHILCYQMMCDFYLSGYKIYCKWHPSDLMPYEDFLKISGTISGNYPSELISIVSPNNFSIGAAISTTGIGNLASMLDRILLFDESYLKTYCDDIYYYDFLHIMKKLSIKEAVAIRANQKQFDNMISFGEPNVNVKIAYLDDVQGIKKTDAYRIIFVMNCEDRVLVEDIKKLIKGRTSNDIFVFTSNHFENIYDFIKDTPFTVHDIVLSAINDNIKEKSVYRTFVFSDNEDYLRRINEMKYEKELINTGIKIVADDSNRDIEIATLKGMLNVTEARMLQYVEENKQLKQTIAEISKKQ